MKEIKNYLCIDNETGEDFIVRARTEKEMRKILAKFKFKDVKFLDILTDYEAELKGLRYIFIEQRTLSTLL